MNDGGIDTPAASKRQKSDSQQTKSSSNSKKTRSNNVTTPGFKRPWNTNQPVWVKIYDGFGGRGWEPGIIRNVIDHHDGRYDIVAIVKEGDDDDGKWVVPHTINEHNYDPIPNIRPTESNYTLSNYITIREEHLEGVPEDLIKQYRLLQYFSGVAYDAKAMPKQDVVGEALLNNDPESPTSIRNILHSLMNNNKSVMNVVKIVTGNEECSVQYALAYIIGQLCGIEISESTSSVSEEDPKEMLRQLVSTANDNVQCPISQVFLMSAMTARTKKANKFDPRSPLFDYRGRSVLSDPKKLKSRLSRLQTALAAMHSSQTDKPPISGPSRALLAHGISLMIDMRGTSDKVLNKLAEEGVCRPARVLRYWVQKLSSLIDPLDVRSPLTSGMTQVICSTADNADFHLFHRCASVVPVGDIQIGIEDKRDTEHFNKHYMNGLGKLSDISVDQLMATEKDDDVANSIIDNQNIVAILTAAIEYDHIRKESVSNRRGGISSRPGIGSNVNFTYRSEKRQGVVQSTSSNNATIQFTDGGHVVSRSIPLKYVGEVVADTTTNNTADADDNHQDDEGRESERKQRPEMFNGERHRFDPSTTSIGTVLTGISSKNNETARQVIQSIITQHGEEKFFESVHVIVADQEFMPTMIAEFFSKLSGDDQLPIIPCLAIGHAMKGLSVSMMSYYKCMFDPMLEALGVKVGSPEYNKYYKGSVIRKTNDLVMNFTETLAVAAAHQYLTEVGKEDRIKLANEVVTSPIAIINAYYASESGSPLDPTRPAVVAMDSHTRPVRIAVSDSLKLIVKDFKVWAKDKWGTKKTDEVGPSGFVKKSAESEGQQLDSVQQEISDSIERDPKYQDYRDINYFDDGENLGLYSQCRNANVIGKSSRKDHDTLSKKLFLLKERNDREKATTFGPARKLPHGMNCTGLVMYDLLFGIERFVLVQGHLLTRVRPRDNPYSTRRRYPTDWLVFFKAITASTFLRWQPNYQRLTLSFLIQLSLILNHKDKRCIDLALKRIRRTCCVSEWGDSHKCTPVDLLQEYSMVAQVKKVGRRNPIAFINLEARVRLHSYLRLQEIESRVDDHTPFTLIGANRVAKAKEEQRMSFTNILFWVSILSAIDKATSETDINKVLGLGNADSEVLFADISRVWFRNTDAIDHIPIAGSAFIKGFTNGYEVKMPPRIPFSILRCLHREKKRAKPYIHSTLADDAQKAKLDAEQSLTEDEYVTVPSSHSILDGLTKAGDGKSNIYTGILSNMSKNIEYKGNDEYIGDGPSKPVVLTRTSNETAKSLLNRANRDEKGQAPILRLIDAAKDLRCFIPNRNGGNTVNDLARDIICQSVHRYYFDGIELLGLIMDVSDCMTTLRLIPHRKRGKLDGIKIPHGSLSRITKGTDDLTAYGARSDLLTCGDFAEILFDTICNQARYLEQGLWKLHRPVKKFALAIVGGSMQACVVVGVEGKEAIRMNNETIALTCQEVEDTFEERKIVKNEEGEMMVYAVMNTMFKMAFNHASSNEGIDCVVEIHSDDSDAFGGIAMQAIYNLESTCLIRSKRFKGAIYLHGPQKSVAQIAKIGNMLQTNIDIDQQLCPATGRGFQFIVDLISVYYTLEQDDSLPELPPGHRAISAVAVPYTIINNDYLSWASYGLTYSKIIATLRSASYKNEVREYAPIAISPIKLTRQAVIMGVNHNAYKGLNLPGIIILLHHAFINRSATKKILLNRYTPEELSDSLPYDVVRASAILAGELHPLPDPVALLCHLSCANLLFRRWTVHLNSSTIQTDDELEASCYSIDEIKGEKVVSIKYDLHDLLATTRNAMNDESLLRCVKQSYYGYLLPTIDSCKNAPMPFNPFNEIKRTTAFHGFYPLVKVPKNLLPNQVTTNTTNPETNLLEEHDEIDSDEEDDEVGGDTLPLVEHLLNMQDAIETGMLPGEEDESDDEGDYGH